DDFSGEILFGLDTTSSPTAASAVSDQPGSVPSCSMAEFDDHTLDLLAASGVISGAPGVAMPSTSVGAGADASDVATGASDVRAALPRTPTTPPAREPMPVFGITPPITPDTSSDTNVPHPLAISSTPAAPFTSTIATPSSTPSLDSVAFTVAAAAAVTIGSTTSRLTTPTPPPAPTSALDNSGTFSAVTTGSTASRLTTPTPPPAATSALDNSGTFSAVTTGFTTSGLTTPTPLPAATSPLNNSGTLSAVTTGSTTSGLTTPTPLLAATSALNNSGTFLGRASSVVLTENSPPSLTAMDDQEIAADTTSDTNVPHPLAISSTLAAPLTVTTATPSFALRQDSVASTAVAAKATVAAAAAVAQATSAPSKLSTSAFAVSPVLGTPSTSDGIDHALAMAIQALKIADRAADDSRLASSPETMSENKQERLTTAIAEFTEKMSMAAPRTSATEMMDAALAACMDQLLVLEERTLVEEETAFSDEVAVRADLGRAMMALNQEKKKKREAEIRAIIGDVRKRRSKRIRSAALSNVRRERDARPVWGHSSSREMWKAGKIVTL
ncbi:unnamed protein product, partial [Ectocarpus sp. 13 AM-2016]